MREGEKSYRRETPRARRLMYDARARSHLEGLDVARGARPGLEIGRVGARGNLTDGVRNLAVRGLTSFVDFFNLLAFSIELVVFSPTRHQ